MFVCVCVNESADPNMHLLLLFVFVGGLLMGGNLDFSTASGKLNSLKRNINSNGRSTTGIGPVSHTHSGNHDNLTNQFVMHTSGGKIYIPQGTTSIHAYISIIHLFGKARNHNHIAIIFYFSL